MSETTDERIVTVNVSQTVAAVPSALQQTGALVSNGASRLAAGTSVLLSQASDLAPYTLFRVTRISVTRDAITVTLDEATPLPASYSAGVKFDADIAGVEGKEASWANGHYTFTVTDSKTLSAAADSQKPTGNASLSGRLVPKGAQELDAMVNTYFAQGNKQAIYLYEIGYTDKPEKAIASLKRYIADPERRFYAYTVPRAWYEQPDFLTLAKLNAANTSMLYFFIDSDTDGTNRFKGIKSVMVVQASSHPAFCNAAGMMWQVISQSPSDINKVPPMAFRFMLGVERYTGKASVKKTLTSNYINYIGTGAEGGISNTLLFNGMTSEGNDFTYWYSVDWVQINAQIALANEIINGSNNPINPLYYNQSGIDRLQNRAQSVLNTGVVYGLVNGNPVVQAVPFKRYTKDNPNDYAIGRYAGLAVEYTPMRGFTRIIFNINVTMSLS